MSIIKILPETLSNKIAAGEVVERPASVVKELVENALDAKAGRINLEVENGGRSLIRVADNGIGMSHDDALLSLERYATSKIYTDQDLFSISSLGFRGEALPSIASVSHLSLVTRNQDTSSGTEIWVAGGKITKVSEVGAPVGTMITVKRLFFNTPARRKFLKTIGTEMGHIADIISSMALGNPDVRLKLLHNGKTVFNWTSSSDPFNRVIDVLGKDIKTDLYPVQSHSDSIEVSGWTASDRHSRKTSRGIYVFVNKRFVRDKVIQHALFEGFSGRLMKGQFPVAVIFIDLPAELVDVNVHPTKHEVRFVDQKRVHDTVARAVSDALKKEPGRMSRPDLPEPRPKAKEVRIGSTTPISSEPVSVLWAAEPAASRQAISKDRIADQKTLWKKRFFGDLRVVGQFHNTYILCESDDGLVMIDQHAAHERIIYEQIKARSSTQNSPRQKLLIPETIDLGYREAKVLTDLIPQLKRSGLEIEPFGGNTFALKAVPALLANYDIKPIIIEMIEKMIEIGFTPGLEKAVDECQKIMACHSAIRANQSLSEKQITELLFQLDQCDNPSNCPHGRPTWIPLTLKSLEKSFKRTD